MDQARDGELALRRGLDRAIGRALVDREYAALLLSQPLIALGGPSNIPWWIGLDGIRPWSLEDFAWQATTLLGQRPS